jgi:hypothetical protein
VTRATPAAGSNAAVNISRGGVVEFAALAPGGVNAGALVALELAVRDGGALPAMRLDIAELNDTKAVNIIARGRATSLGPAACAAHAESAVHISGLSPTSAIAGEIVVVTITGCGFDAEGNVVVFGPATVSDVKSTAGGTRLEFGVPTEVRSRGEVPPMMLGAGGYPVSVRSSRGTSNVLVFTLK